MSEEVTAAFQDFLAGGGEMGALMRAFDWSSTPVGPIESWSQSLRTTVSLLLASRYPMTVIWGADLIQFYNDGYMQLLGSKHPAALGRPHRETFAEVLDTVGPMIRSVMTTGTPIWEPEQLLLLERDGYLEECYFTLSYSPVKDDTGAIAGMLCVCSETTQKVLGERRLRLLRDLASRASEARTVEMACHDMIAAMSDHPLDVPFALIYLREPDGKTVTLQGAVGLTAGTDQTPLTVDLCDRDLWSLAAAASGETVLLENLARQSGPLPSGPWQDSADSALVLPLAASSQAAPMGVLVAGMSPRRALDEGYRSFLELLAGQVATAITNARAYEAERKRAEALTELDRAKTTFFSNVSHEFRTPLTLMLGPLEDALVSLERWEQSVGDPSLPPSSLCPSTLKQQLQLSQRNGLRLLKLVNTLLDFSRIEANRLQAIYRPTDLATFTTDLVSVFRAAVEQAGLQLIVDCPPLPEPIYVDRQMWEKIVLNLVSNAFKFTFAGEIRVSLRWESEEGRQDEFRRSLPSTCVLLEVQDTGTGIPAEALPHLFERFYQVEGTHGRTYEGSGIGLALVQELVQRHGGTVEVTSTLGQGTCFTVRIPAGCAHLPTERLAVPTSSASTLHEVMPYVEEALRWLPEQSKGSGELQTRDEQGGSRATPASARILVVDDNPDMREYLRRLLRNHYQVETASDGAAAIAMVQTWSPNLVLSDVMMPQVDGFTLLRSLRADPNTTTIPVILLSARAGEEAQIEGLEAGADDYLIKPFSARELLARVETNLKLAQLRREATYREQVIQETQALVKALSAERNALQKAKTAIEASEQRLRFLAESIPQIVWIAEPNGFVEYFNQRWFQYSGLTLEESQSKGENFRHPDDHQRYLEAWTKATQTKGVLQVEQRFRRADGLYRWHLTRAHPMLDATGEIVKWFGTCTDIHDRKQAEEALQQKNQRLNLLSETANELLLNEQPQEFIDRLFTKLSPHLGLEVYFYYLVNSDQQLQLHAYRGITPAIAKEYKFIEIGHAVCGFVAQHQQPIIQEHIMRSTEPILAQVQALGITAFACYPLIAHDQVIGILSFGTRSRPQFQPDELELMQTVCNQVAVAAERSRFVEQLQQQTEELARANRRKDEFLAVLSHELRSPLNPILGWAKMLRSRRLDEEMTARALEAIERNAKLQTQLVEDLLDVSRILQGKLSLNIQHVDLTVAIDGALDTVRLAAEAKSIQIKTRIDPVVGQVLGDINRLQQIIWNLLSNAIKFTPKGGRVELRLEQVGENAQIRISDTGQGIDSNFLPHAFDYFRQADSTTTRMFGGLGLGLAIVRHLVELHGGTVHAASPGENLGSTFVVQLPLAQATSKPKSLRTAQNPSDNFLMLRGVTILVVDDEADMREFLAFVLEQSGAEVTTAASAQEALQVLLLVKPDVLLCDIGMPNMNGYELIRRVKQLLPNPSQLAAIALTAYAGAINQEQALKAGFNRHLAKPVEPPELTQAITSLLRQLHSPMP